MGAIACPVCGRRCDGAAAVCQSCGCDPRLPPEEARSARDARVAKTAHREEADWVKEHREWGPGKWIAEAGGVILLGSYAAGCVGLVSSDRQFAGIVVGCALGLVGWRIEVWHRRR